MRSLLAVLVAALPLHAADIDLKPVYFQTIPYDVLADATGTPWFRDAAGIHTANGVLVCRAPEGRWLLADRAGRFWFAVGGDQYTQPDVRYYDAGKRIDPGIKSRGGVWEDTTGRVFAFDGRAVHILADGKWAKHTAMMPEHIREVGEAKFVEDPKGRVWVWLRIGNALAGAWAFDGKKWTGQAIPGCEEDERVRLVLPFADDWFLVGIETKADGPNFLKFVPFSPSRTPEQVAKAKPFAGLPLDRQSNSGEALDGKRYFFRPVQYTPQGTEPSGSWSVSADGVVTPIDDDPHKQIDHRLYAASGPSAAAVTAIYAQPGERLGRLLGSTWGQASRDTQGRVYVRGGRMPDMSWTEATHLLWPAKEKFGDVLRLTPLKPEEFVADLFRDSTGTAFARRSLDTVRVWDGKTWAGTPVEPLPSAKWDEKGQFPPAELAWSGFGLVGHSTAADGRTLIVRVKTRFAASKDGKFDPPPEDEKDPPPFWVYEAWSHKDGAWSDAHPPAELLKAKRKELIDGRVQPQQTPGPLPVYSDGTRLWHAQDWTLTVTEADGTTHTAAIPKPKRYVPPKLTAEELKRKLFAEMSSNAGPRPEYRNVPEPLMLATLVPLDAKSVLVVVAGTPATSYRATFRTAKPRGVVLDLLDSELSGVFPTVFAPKDSPPLAWLDQTPTPMPLDWIGMRDPKWETTYVGHDLYEFRDGKWAKRTDLFKPTAVADDGAVWCPPTDREAEPKGTKLTVCRLHADKVERFAWNYGDEKEGVGMPPPGAALFAANHELVCVEPPTRPGGKATLRVLPCVDNPAPNPLLLPDGALLFPTTRGKLLEAKGK